MIQIIPIAIGVAVVCRIWGARPSTLMRVVEDAAIAVPRGIAKRAGKLKREVKVEYEARLVDRMQERIAGQQAALRRMSRAELAALAKDEARILERAEQLRTKREARRAKRAPAEHHATS
jgi:ribosome-binding protein aMBF1 (putative translation factor)